MADKIVLIDALVEGVGASAVPIRYHDNGDGTWSQVVQSSGGGGGGGGDASAANQATQITAANLGNTDLGGVTETAPASDTASSGLNGRLQRIAQNLTSAAAGQSNGSQVAVLSGGVAQAAVGIVAKANVFGALSTSGALVTLFNDSFDAALDTSKWTLSGTTPPVASGTAVSLSLTAANSVSSSMVGVPAFTPQGAPYVLAGQLTLGAQQSNPNVVRLFGASVVTGFSAANPTTDGHQWEVDVTGALCACVYIAGVRYVVNSTNPALITPSGSWAANMTMSNYGQNLTWPASGTAIVTMQYYSGLVYFFMASAITGMDIPVGVASYVPSVAALPVRIAAISTPATSTVLATTYTVSGMLLGAIGGTNFTQADPTYPWRQQQVDASGRSAVITPELTATGSITTQNLVPAGVATAGSAVSLSTNGMPNLMIQVTGTYTGALSLQVTVDGVNWITVGGVPLINLNTGGYLAAITSALQSIFQAEVSGAIAVRITGLAAMTGTAVVTLRATPGAAMVSLDSALPTGANTIGAVNLAAAQTLATVTTVATVTTLAGTTTLTPGVAAANLGKAEDAVSASGDTGVFVLGVRRDTLTVSASATGDYNELATDSFGSTQVRDYEKQARTYSCSVNVAAAASATDIATLTGSASTTVFVTRVIISGIQTTAGLNDVLLIKRSTADTGGTSTAGTALAHDSSDAAATATVLAYTANPTAGTPIATLRRNYLPIGGATSVVNPVVEYKFGENGRPLVLRGIAQVLAVNLNGVTLTGGTFDVNFEWFEI